MATFQADNIHLLLVDDEADFRATLVKRLGKRGIAVQEADCGPAGLQVLEQQTVDVVVLDVKMPGMSGIDVLHRIKDRFSKIEVILLTGHSDTSDGIEGIKSGAFDYLTKPIEFEHLLEKIKQACEKRRRDEERRREAEYKEQIKQQMIVTERLAALGTLAAGVAHEINNPLAIINEAAGYLTSLLKKQELTGMPRRQDFEKTVNKINAAVVRARAITHQLLGSVGKQSPVLAQIDLKELTEEAIRLVAKEATEKEIALAVLTQPGMDAVWIDPHQIRQVLLNLLTNAIHATDRGGKITVTIGREEDVVTLSVSDTGKGIPRENMDKIFEPFFSDKPPGQGTGLGLFVTREIVDKLGGAIDVRSRVGKGTTMAVTIPLQAPANTALSDDQG